jgi:Cu(I)/Ag(I) efflux system membrane fusion protein
MKTQSIVAGVVVAGVLAAGGGYALYQLGMTRGMSQSDGAPASNIDPASGKRVLYWHDPMVPGQRFDAPGKSPFMDMMLVPMYADDDADETSVAVSPRMQQTLGIRTAEVTRSTLTVRVDAVGNIAFNERDQAIVQARATGYVERLHVRATLDRVAAGQVLADLYVPDWVAAQEEFLAVRRMRGDGLDALIAGARQRMRQVGMSDAQIGVVEASGSVQPRITLTAPIDGVLVELLVREGMTVLPGATLFRVNSLATVWAIAEIAESRASLLRAGANVEVRSGALPGRVFTGTVEAILPDVDPVTRTVKARVELANPDRQLVPGMFVSVALTVGAAEGLAVPTEAVIHTGTRTVVIVAEPADQFRPVDVEIGIETNGQTEIKRGLEAGQRVVASGQFLLDSEASLRATETRMEEMPPVQRDAAEPAR